MSIFLTLADRCEAATGPDRELDYWIMQKTVAEGRGYLWDPADLNHRYTASIDAAMTLMANGWDHIEAYQPDYQTLGWTVHIMPNANISRATWTGFAQSYALALCAAALRARDASVDERAERQDPQGLSPQDASAATAQPADAQPQSEV